MTAVRLVVTDLDGTLVDGSDRIHPAAVEAVAALAARGVDLLVATGRRFASAQRVMAAHGLAPPAVLLAGAVGADLATGEEWHRAPLAADDGLAALAAFRRHGLEPVVYVGDADLDAVAAATCSTNPAHLAQFGLLLHRDDPDAVVAAGRCIGLGVCGVPDRGLAEVAADLAGIAEPWLGPDHSYGGSTLMVSPRGVTKVLGIARWCEARGIAAEEVVAVGDGSNDVDMLRWSGIAVAVQGGMTADWPHDHVIGGPAEGGWARLATLL